MLFSNFPHPNTTDEHRRRRIQRGMATATMADAGHVHPTPIHLEPFGGSMARSLVLKRRTTDDAAFQKSANKKHKGSHYAQTEMETTQGSVETEFNERLRRVVEVHYDASSEVEDYIMNGYGARTINDGYASRQVLWCVEGAQYALYDDCESECDL